MDFYTETISRSQKNKKMKNEIKNHIAFVVQAIQNILVCVENLKTFSWFGINKLNNLIFLLIYLRHANHK